MEKEYRMFKVLLRLFSVCGFFVLGLAGVHAQAQAPTLTLYGITLNAPLSVPKCEVDSLDMGVLYFPESACYMLIEKKKLDSSGSRSAYVYFPENEQPVGALSNDMYISLDYKNYVIALGYFADSLSSQEDFWEKVIDQIGSPYHLGVQGSSDTDAVTLWKFDGVNIMFMSNEKGMVMVMVMDSPS